MKYSYDSEFDSRIMMNFVGIIMCQILQRVKLTACITGNCASSSPVFPKFSSLDSALQKHAHKYVYHMPLYEAYSINSNEVDPEPEVILYYHN